MDVLLIDLKKKFIRPKKSAKKVPKSADWMLEDVVVLDAASPCRGVKPQKFRINKSRFPLHFSMPSIFHPKMTKAPHSDLTKNADLIPPDTVDDNNNSSLIPTDSPAVIPLKSPLDLNSVTETCDMENCLAARPCRDRKLDLEGTLRARYHWSLVRQFICCTFAIRDAKRKPWVQLAGHADSFQTGEVGTVLKKLCKEELACMELLMQDPVKPFVPLFLGVRNVNGEDHIEMRDLLTGFDSSASVMDCKIGVRTYLEDELTKAKKDPKLRPDMYQKMIDVDPNEPTPEEHAAKAVTKPRYMQWRETLSSSATLGFRIEAVRKCGSFSSKDFKDKRQRSDVVAVLRNFTDSSPQIIEMYIHRLQHFDRVIGQSPFFATHEIIGSSLLLIHDCSGLAGVWMIDFAKTVPLPDHIRTDHLRPWVEGNHEEGYLMGLRNLISCFEEILLELRTCPASTA